MGMGGVALRIDDHSRSFSAANGLAIWDIDANISTPIVSVPQGANIIGTLPPGLN